MFTANVSATGQRDFMAGSEPVFIWRLCRGRLYLCMQKQKTKETYNNSVQTYYEPR